MFSVVYIFIWLFENVFLLSEGCSWLLLKPFRLFILYGCLRLFRIVQFAHVAFSVLGNVFVGVTNFSLFFVVSKLFQIVWVVQVVSRRL